MMVVPAGSAPASGNDDSISAAVSIEPEPAGSCGAVADVHPPAPSAEINMAATAVRPPIAMRCAPRAPRSAGTH
jgi:hypothetical protein